MSVARRVWVTGIGMLTPLGGQREASWNALLAGQRGLHRLSVEDQSLGEWPDRAAGGPVAFDLDAPSLSLETPTDRLARCAAEEALADARLDLSECDRDRVGCVVGTSKGCMRSFARRLHPSFDETQSPPSAWMSAWTSGPADNLSRLLDLRGPLLSPVSACATGLSSILRGAELIREGVCDVVLAGSADASLTPAMLASFRRLGVLAKGDDEPAFSVKPFDRRRSGFLVGEGAAMFVLEAAEHARARQRSAYAEWLTGGGMADATGLTQLNPDPTALVRLIEDTLRRADLSPCDIDYISLHGTGTAANDDVEARAIQQALGSSASKLCCSSLKGSIGHLLGAAGSVEFAAMLLAIRDSRIPPTVNLREPEYDLDFVPNVARQRDVHVAIKLSLGFGGHLVAGIVSQPR